MGWSGGAISAPVSYTHLDVYKRQAGHTTGHCLENRSANEARYLVIGTRNTKDIIHYPDLDLTTHKDGKARRYTHADGRPRSAGDKT